MDIIDLINSRDVRAYLRSIRYPLTTPEAALVVYLNDTLSLEKKMEAWRTIIAEMPDCSMHERMSMMEMESVHRFLEAYIALQKEGILNFRRSNGCVYHYSYHKTNGEWGEDGFQKGNEIFSSYELCARHCQDEVLSDGDVDRINIHKHKLDTDPRDDSILLDANMEILETSFYFEQEREKKIYLAFDGMCFDFPTPFRRGDILIPCQSCKSWQSMDPEPFVLSYLTTWDFYEMKKRGFSVSECPYTTGWQDFDRERDRLLEEGDICDMRAVGPVVHEDGTLDYDNILTPPLNLEYFRGELKGMQRQLKICSEFEKGEADGTLLVNCCSTIQAEEFAKEVSRWHTCFYQKDYMQEVDIVPAERETHHRRETAQDAENPGDVAGAAGTADHAGAGPADHASDPATAADPGLVEPADTAGAAGNPTGASDTAGAAGNPAAATDAAGTTGATENPAGASDAAGAADPADRSDTASAAGNPATLPDTADATENPGDASDVAGAAPAEAPRDDAVDDEVVKERLREEVRWYRREYSREPRIYLDVPCPVCGNKMLVTYGPYDDEEEPFYLCHCCGWDYDGIVDEDAFSEPNGDSIRGYRLHLLNDLLQEKWEEKHGVKPTPSLHPKEIPVAKSVLERKLSNYDDPKNLLQVLAFGETHPRFEEWLVKASIKFQEASSLVYLREVRGVDGRPKIEVAKLSEKEYEEKIFDPHCENIDECRDLLVRIFEEEGRPAAEVTDALVQRTFEKFCAIKRYTLPMIANTAEYEYFSFFYYIIDYVARHDDSLNAESSPSGYRYPDLPGMYDCDIDFDY